MPKAVNIDDQNHAVLTSQSLRAAIGPLQFSLRHWNLRNLTLHSGILSYKHASRSLKIFSACTVLSHGSIMLPPHHPRVFDSLGWIVGNYNFVRCLLFHNRSREFSIRNSTTCFRYLTNRQEVSSIQLLSNSISIRTWTNDKKEAHLGCMIMWWLFPGTSRYCINLPCTPLRAKPEGRCQVNILHTQ